MKESINGEISPKIFNNSLTTQHQQLLLPRRGNSSNLNNFLQPMTAPTCK